jgi:hypothetical protein
VSDNINLVGREMCEECDAFLGKAHKDTCSKKGRLVEMGDATEKFTTVEHAEAEEPMLGLDPKTVELLLNHITTHDTDPDFQDVVALVEGMKTFLLEVAKPDSEEGS